MKAKRVDEFHGYGCNFYGKLVVVHYMEDAKNDPRMGQFNAGVSYDYLDKAKQLVNERGYKIRRVMLSVPVYVAEIE